MKGHWTLISALDGGEWSTPRPGRFTPGKETGCPLYLRLGGPQSRSSRVWKVSFSQGFDPRIAPPAAGRHTDCAIPAHKRSDHSEGTHRPCPSPPGRHHVGGALAAGRTNVGAATTLVFVSTHRQLQAAAESDMLNENYRPSVIQYVASHF